jgi:hypothetical protein
VPVSWHHFESWATLALELGVPVFMFVGARRVRLACAAVLTGFQIINAASANYGFFCYLAAALHVFLLDDSDVERISAWLRARLRLRAHPSLVECASRRRQRIGGVMLVAFFVAISTVDGLINFVESARVFTVLLPLRRVYAPFRIVNTYHLFGHITRARIEPEFQTTDDGETWLAHELHHKPGDIQRRPDWVAPHQPRVDFQLWFYGLGYHGGAPEYVGALIERLCRDPAAVQPLFRSPLTAHPKAARIVFWQYHFTTTAERRATGAWWKREPVDVTDAIPCDTAFPKPDTTDED